MVLMASEELQPEGRLWLLVILVLLVFGGALVYFTRQNPEITDYNAQARLSQPAESRPARVYTVYYNAGVFSPTNLRIHKGDSVKFQNDGDQPVHIVADDLADLVGLDSIGDVPPRSSFAYTFTKTGTFGYNNSRNKAERGTVIVRP